MTAITEYRGVKNLVYAEVTADTENAYTTGTVKPLAGVATISKATSSSAEAHYYDNAPKIVITSQGSDEVTLTVSAIPLETYADITGQQWDSEHGCVIEGPRTQKSFAIGYETKRTDGSKVYVWRLKGAFSIPDQESSTENDGTDASGQEITYTGVETVYAFTSTGKGARSVVVDDSLGLAQTGTWFAAVVTPDTIATRT
ncbi:MAG: hypothetical protein IKQ60_06445 [Candidatus Methanomethylophilaceae archaeon]|nr:hypothetical protein [Candidatus Methanomethylophilaceae archaeon]